MSESEKYSPEQIAAFEKGRKATEAKANETAYRRNLIKRINQTRPLQENLPVLTPEERTETMDVMHEQALEETGNIPTPPQEEPKLTPEDIQGSLVKKPTPKPEAGERTDYVDKSKIKSSKGQKARILRAKWKKLISSPGPEQPPKDVKDY